MLAFSSIAQVAAVSGNAKLLQHALETSRWLACIHMRVNQYSEDSPFQSSGGEDTAALNTR